jgi:hypothetical protein
MTDLNVRAVLVGSLVDVGGSILVGGLVFTLIGAISGASTPEQFTALLDGSVPLQIASLALGLLFTGVGGYVAARMVRGTERVQAFGVGVVSTLIGFTVVFASPESSPFWLQAASLLFTIPAAFAGGEVRRATMRERRRVT